MDVLVYCDGKTEIEEISRLCGLGLTVVDQCLSELEENGLIVEA
jgi:predicted transcriptional regulator